MGYVICGFACVFAFVLVCLFACAFAHVCFIYMMSTVYSFVWYASKEPQQVSTRLVLKNDLAQLIIPT
eukprot:m.195945 g.195945  ORF g.195945 m.195945 type:complete len:68 (+) comp32594_c7_seq1:92-295(+)